MRAHNGYARRPTHDYIEKAKTLSNGDATLLNERVAGRFTRRREDKNKSAIEIRALQMEFEDTQLREWRQRLETIRDVGTLASSGSLLGDQSRTNRMHFGVQQ